MKALLLVIALLVAAPCFGQATAKGTLTTRFSETGANIQTAGAAWTAALAVRSYLSVDIVNMTDCDLELRFDDATNAPAVFVTEGSSASVDFGKYGYRVDSSVEVRKIQTDTCSSGTVYVQGMIADVNS